MDEPPTGALLEPGIIATPINDCHDYAAKARGVL
jgi:hypothetical protein